MKKTFNAEVDQISANILGTNHKNIDKTTSIIGAKVRRHKVPVYNTVDNATLLQIKNTLLKNGVPVVDIKNIETKRTYDRYVETPATVKKVLITTEL